MNLTCLVIPIYTGCRVDVMNQINHQGDRRHVIKKSFALYTQSFILQPHRDYCKHNLCCIAIIEIIWLSRIDFLSRLGSNRKPHQGEIVILNL